MTSLPPRPDLPGPMRRRGPRPLALHLGLAPSGPAGLPSPSQPEAGGGHPDPALIAGIAAYRRHPYQRSLPDPPAVWNEGDSRLLDYAEPGAGGPRVLFVPSLVNRSSILDLAPQRSMLRFMAGHGVRAALLDWGWPGAVERRFNLTDYVAGRLERAVGAMAGGGPIVLAGYCMGGLLALAAAQRRPERVMAVALLATPWDFHAADPGMAQRMAMLLPRLEPVLAGGTLPVDALQTLFAAESMASIARRFRAFPALDPGSEAAAMFVAQEDWLADGVPLPAPVARDVLGGWYGRNEPARGQWRVAGQPVDPGALRMPSFVAVPGRDRIVPPQGARPLAALLTGSRLVEPDTGHVAMVAGARAQTLLWVPLLDWIRSL